MTRRNISLPDDLDELARQAGLNVSALARQAIVAELDRIDRMTRLDAWLDELDALHGPPSAKALAEAEAWARSAVPVARSERTAKVGAATSVRTASPKKSTKALTSGRPSTKKPRREAS